MGIKDLFKSGKTKEKEAFVRGRQGKARAS